VGEVFELFSRPQNLGIMTPANMGFAIMGISVPMEERALISYRIRIGGVPLRWKTRIDVWEPGQRCVDSQLRGPYHSWWHEHRFVPDGASRTIMEDRVLYTPPFGNLGRLANGLFIKGALRTIFAFRSDAIRVRFGESTAIERVRIAS